MISIKNCYLHLVKILTHKYWVCYYCFKCGLYWQGIIHDLSKFSFIEFFESAKYYQGTISPIDACKEKNGVSLAWQHHKGRNKHHFEYWVDFSSKNPNKVFPLKMPKKYAIEMLCDYIGAGRAYSGKTFTFAGELAWWQNRKLVVFMHEETLDYISKCFEKLAELEKTNNTNIFFKNKLFIKYCL